MVDDERAVEQAAPGACLAALGASTSFSGGGSTTRTGALSAVLTARVAEVRIAGPYQAAASATDTPSRLTRRQNRIPMLMPSPPRKRMLESGSRSSTAVA